MRGVGIERGGVLQRWRGTAAGRMIIIHLVGKWAVVGRGVLCILFSYAIFLTFLVGYLPID